MRKRLPNLISCGRIALSLSLPFWLGSPIVFAVVYALCGISDALDGYLARRWNAQTGFGAKLDSLADLLFFGVAVYVLSALTLRAEAGWMVIAVVAIAVVRAANLVITRMRFAQWGIMHTLGNKLAGLCLFFLLPICVLAGGIPLWAAVPAGVAALLTALEETAILLTASAYDIDRKHWY